MSTVADAVILMAGMGSRFKSVRDDVLKPLIPVLGRPLASYIFETLERAGITTAHVIVGYRNETLVPQLKSLIPRSISAHFIYNHDWAKQNGISLLQARTRVASPFLLTMTDHLFDRKIVEVLLEQSDPARLNIAIDRKLESIVDINDAMKIQTRADDMIAIGKHLSNYDAIDTGIFICPQTIFDYLERAKHDGDCGLADGVRLMAEDKQVRMIDIGDAWWQDIDNAEMLAAAEEQLRLRAANRIGANV